MLKILFSLLLLMLSGNALAKECVILLHGLLRGSGSMVTMERALVRAGYEVSNIDYPSRGYKIEQLAEMAIDAGIQSCQQKSATPINFVTHSLGGILVRVYFKTHQRDDLHRVVMLGPPNRGSEVVDKLKGVPGFEWLNGQAGMHLGTAPDDIPRLLGPVDFELGVIAGTRSINFLLSPFVPNPDDGVVSVASTTVEGMRDFIALPATHTFMMKNERVIEQVIHFLKNGRFSVVEP